MANNLLVPTRKLNLPPVPRYIQMKRPEFEVAAMPDTANPNTLVDRLDALETRIAYQDETIEELHTALAAQWQEIDKLRRDMALLEAQVREAASPGDSGLPEPPPPHY